MQQCGFATGNNFIVCDRQPKPFEFVYCSGSIIAGGIRQNTYRLSVWGIGTPSLLTHQFQAEPCRGSRRVASTIERIGLDCASNLMRVLIILTAPGMVISRYPTNCFPADASCMDDVSASRACPQHSGLSLIWSFRHLAAFEIGSKTIV